MADDQPLRQCIADLPDADLQGAAVGHEAGCMKPDRVFGVADRLGRRGEQRKIRRGAFEKGGKFIRRQIAGARHEWQPGIDLADQLERRAALPAGAQDVERGVGVTAQAVARHAIDHTFRDQLSDDVQPARQQIGRGMGIVRGDVMLLRERHMQPFAGQEEELDHLYVGWQFAGMQRAGVGQVGIAAKQAINHRADEAPFEQARGPRFFQRQRRKQGELDRTVGGGTRVQRVDDMVGLAKPERQADHEVGSDIADDILRERFGIGKQLWHHVADPGHSWRANRPESDASQRSYSVFAAGLRL